MDHLCYFCFVFVMLSCASVSLYLMVTCWERTDLLVPVSCHFPIGILGQVRGLIVSIPGICPLSDFVLTLPDYKLRRQVS